MTLCVPGAMLGGLVRVVVGGLGGVVVGRFVGVYKNIMVAAGVTSVGDPSKKTATHSTTVPLYCGSAGTVRVCTILPFSLTEPDLMSGKSLVGEPFTLQKMKALDDV